AFDARGRHRVHIGHDEETARGGEVSRREDAHARTAGAEGYFRLRQDLAFLLLVAAIGDADIRLEAGFDLARRLADPLDAVIADERDLGTFQRGDHTGGEADDAGRAEDRNF